MRKRVTLKIYGIVQGVFFRYNTQEIAKQFKIVGWVKNERDNTVIVDAEGEVDNLNKFIDWCKNGPKRAKVTQIDIKWGEATNTHKIFEIKK